MTDLLVPLLLAYLIGSFSPAHLAGKLKGIDLASEGSGNLGARNVKRMIGKGAAAAILLADLCKGALAVLLALQLSRHPYAAGAGWLGVILGHGFPFYLRFKGGKGLAASAGAMLAASPLLLLTELGIGLAAFLASRNVYIASIAMTLLLPAGAFFIANEPLFVPSWPIALLILWFHRGNIRQFYLGG